MAGIKITGVKVVGICSKCRKEGDEIMKNKDRSVIPDEELSCPGCALGGGVQTEIELGLKESSWENLFKVIRNNNLNPSGGFWASVQSLEDQLERRIQIKGRTSIASCCTCGSGLFEGDKKCGGCHRVLSKKDFEVKVK